MLDTAVEALHKFDWGTDLGALNPIEEAVIAAHEKAEIGQDLERRFIKILNDGELSVDALGYIFRKLAIIGSAACVPAVVPWLLPKDVSHMARFALERIAAPEAGQALRDALPKVTGDQKIGVISSLGARRESASVVSLGELLKDADPAISRAAARALGTIGNADSAAVLQSALRSSGGNPPAVVDALLNCAELLLAGNKLSDADSIYRALSDQNQSRIVRLAATRGLLACASKSV